MRTRSIALLYHCLVQLARERRRARGRAGTRLVRLRLCSGLRTRHRRAERRTIATPATWKTGWTALARGVLMEAVMSVPLRFRPPFALAWLTVAPLAVVAPLLLAGCECHENTGGYLPSYHCGGDHDVPRGPAPCTEYTRSCNGPPSDEDGCETHV